MTEEKPKALIVQPEWRGSRLMVGLLTFGEVLKPLPMTRSVALSLGIYERNDAKWIGLRGDIATGYYETEIEARKSVEVALKEALTGKETKQ